MLQKIIEKNLLNITCLLSSLQISIDIQDKNGNTLLYNLIEIGNFALIKEALYNGAGISIKNKDHDDFIKILDKNNYKKDSIKELLTVWSRTRIKNKGYSQKDTEEIVKSLLSMAEKDQSAKSKIDYRIFIIEVCMIPCNLLSRKDMNPYSKMCATLRLKKGANKKDIESAYRKLCFKYHPDKTECKYKKGIEIIMQVITAIYTEH